MPPGLTAKFITGATNFIECRLPLSAGKLVTAQGKPVQIEFLLHQAEQQRHLMPYLRHLKRLEFRLTFGWWKRLSIMSD